MNEITILYIIYIASILLHVISVFVTAVFIVPLQIKESKVKNGLISLRKNLLYFGFLVIAVGIVSIIALTLPLTPFDGAFRRWVSVVVVALHAISYLGFSIVGYQIYHTQYSPDVKKLHEKIERLEKRRKKE